MEGKTIDYWFLDDTMDIVHIVFTDGTVVNIEHLDYQRVWVVSNTEPIFAKKAERDAEREEE